MFSSDLVTFYSRDVSARNVLIDRQGRAKLGDLGQAKVLSRYCGTNSSRSNTGDGSGISGDSKLDSSQASEAPQSHHKGMPVTNAYAAPEALAGRYAAPGDVYSCGVLFGQLCSGEYPRVNNREAQVSRACEALPAAAQLLASCLQLHPEQRPSAAAALQTLEELHRTSVLEGSTEGLSSSSGGGFRIGGVIVDATQPVVLEDNAYRRGGDDDVTLTHPHGAGVLAERWFRRALASATASLEQRCAASEAKLTVERERWQQEASARAAVEQRVEGFEERATAAEQVAANERAATKRAREAKARETAAKAQAEGALQREKAALADLQSKLDATLVELEEAKQATVGAKGLQAVAEKRAAYAREQQQEALAAQQASDAASKELAEALNAETSRADELSARFEQALSRWETEKGQRLDAQQEARTLRQSLRETTAAATSQRASLEAAESRLAEYAVLPSPEELLERAREAEQRASEAEAVAMAQQDAAAQLQASLAASESTRKVLQQRAESEEARANKAEAAAADAKRAQQAAVALADAAEAQLAVLSSTRAEQARELKEVHAAHAQSQERVESLELELNLAKVNAAAALAELEAAKSNGNGSRSSSGSVAGGVPESDPSSGANWRASQQKRPGSSSSNSNGEDSLPPINTARHPPDASAPPPPMRSGAAKALVAATVNARGVGGLAQLFVEHSHDADLLARVARALKDLCAGSSDSKNDSRSSSSSSSGMTPPPDSGAAARAAARASGLCRLLCSALAAHAEHLALQRDGCRTLGNLSFGSNANRRDIGAAGGCRCVVAALRWSVRTAESDLCAVACSALCNLAHGDAEDHGNRELLEQAGAAAAVCDGMRTWTSDARVQKQACWALLTLAASDSLAVQTYEAGGVAALVAALVNCPSDAAVQHFGCWALANLTWNSDAGAGNSNDKSSTRQVITEARAQGAAEVCRVAARRFPKHPGVVEKASLVLDNIGAL